MMDSYYAFLDTIDIVLYYAVLFFIVKTAYDICVVIKLR